MKIKNGFVLSKIGNDTVAVATGELSREFSSVIMLNDTSVFLWKLLERDTTREKMIAEVLRAYDAAESEVEEDVDDFIALLREAGVIEE